MLMEIEICYNPLFILGLKPNIQTMLPPNGGEPFYLMLTRPISPTQEIILLCCCLPYIVHIMFI